MPAPPLVRCPDQNAPDDLDQLVTALLIPFVISVTFCSRHFCIASMSGALSRKPT